MKFIYNIIMLQRKDELKGYKKYPSGIENRLEQGICDFIVGEYKVKSHKCKYRHLSCKVDVLGEKVLEYFPSNDIKVNEEDVYGL